jgi:hypothetical protein
MLTIRTLAENSPTSKALINSDIGYQFTPRKNIYA